jgi:DNA replication and repair protein RecF
MITDLRLQHFRSYTDASFDVNPGVNIVVGPNGSGKTNLLEAVLVLARGSSYRAKDSELVQFDQPWARLDANFTNSSTRVVKLTPEASPAKLYELDGKSYQRLSLEKTLPLVLFEPDHLRLLSGGPERRRDYLDDLLEQTVGGYNRLRSQYRRVLAQRNAFLKKNGVNYSTQIFPWNIRLSEMAGQIVRYRSNLTAQINNEIGELYKKLSATKNNIEIDYSSRWPVENYESQLIMKLEQSIGIDLARGFTGAGPHREDLAVSFDKHPAQLAASRGEIRTIVLALKIIELKLLEGARNSVPLLLLDDVFSELDDSRRHALTDYLASYQTLITTTNADLIMHKLANSRHNIINLG